jgi:hypothetical protein
VTILHGLRISLVLALVALLGACHGGRTRSDIATVPSDVPASFDVILLADKDGQFDFDGAPLTSEDLKSALRYRQEESLPVATILLKPGEKQKIKGDHIQPLARIAHELGIKAYFEDDGEISELRVQVKSQ